MKRMNKILCMLIGVFMLAGIFVVPAQAAIDIQKDSSLAVQYKYQEKEFEGLEIQTYQIATMESHELFVTTEAFSHYPVKINGIHSQKEWDQALHALEGYIVADQLEATYVEMTDEAGIAHFEHILPGLYLTVGTTVENETETVIFKSFLTVIPHPNGDGTYNYDLLKIPKWTVYTPEPNPEPITYTVVKQWKDYGFETVRPEQIGIEIYKEDVLTATTCLSAENNWSYSWEAEDDGASWHVVETEGAEEYTVTVSEDGNTFVVTNARESEEKMPQTGDTTLIWPYILGMCVSGMLFIIIAIWRNRRDNE